MDPFQNDSKFLARFRAGEAAALDRVYRLYYRPLRSFILRGFAFQSEGRQLYFGGMVQDSDVEDVIQETFRRAFGVRARETYDGVRPYKNYLFTIARNAVITDLTVRSRQIPVGEALMRDAPSDELSPLQSWVLSQRCTFDPDDTPVCEERLENLEIYGLLAAFMESLDDESRVFFETRFIGQLSQENTAREMGWNRARVRKLEARLRKAFLTHASGSGYLEMRAEARKVRRVEDPDQHEETLARSRALWREGRAEAAHELIFEAA
ncbi:MAG: sigma-70 family RNA polymerase sigma factor [Myxococcota bacterium]